MMSVQNLLCAAFLLSTLGFGCQAECTDREQILLLSCLTPYNSKFIQALGNNRNGQCNSSLITSDLCQDFAAMVKCANELDISNDRCRPVGKALMNQIRVIPCSVEDFEKSCPDAPKINTGNSGSRKEVTLPLMMMSLLTIFAITTFVSRGL